MPAVEQDVLGLDIAMNDTASVREAQGLGYLTRDFYGVIDWELLLTFQSVAE